MDYASTGLAVTVNANAAYTKKKVFRRGLANYFFWHVPAATVEEDARAHASTQHVLIDPGGAGCGDPLAGVERIAIHGLAIAG